MKQIPEVLRAMPLMDAANAALFLIRDDATNIAKQTATILRASIAAEKARLAEQHDMAGALRLCLHEIEQYHAFAYPKCGGNCPAHEAMTAARAALAHQEGR